MRRKWMMFGVMGGLLVVLGGTAWVQWRRPETTAAIRGKKVAARMGCFACHGPEGSGGVTDLGGGEARGGDEIPGWDPRTAAMYVRNEEEIRRWILQGRPEEETEDETDPPPPSPEEGPRIPMPAYEGLLSERELDDLVAYFLAVCGPPDIPADAYEGRVVAERLGCFGCHGPSGMGGIPNPRSFKGEIPPWDGEEFRELVRDDGELREWILDGRTRRFQANPAARFFLDRQIIDMPPYRDSISDDEMQKIMTYIHWLRNGE